MVCLELSGQCFVGLRWDNCEPSRADLSLLLTSSAIDGLTCTELEASNQLLALMDRPWKGSPGEYCRFR